MKKLSNLLAALVFVSLVIFMSCGSDSGTDPVDPADAQAALLQDSWTVNASQVVYENGNPDVDWTGFTLSITGASASGGSYSVSGVPTGFESVWPSCGTWTFNNNNIDELLRCDNIVMDVSSVSETSLTLTFNVPDTGGRTAGIAGSWSFTFSGN
jgi:hypothetical protein